MGLEVSDACLVKEPNGVLLYPNGDIQDSNMNTSSNHNDAAVKLHHQFSITEACEARNRDEQVAKKFNSRTSNGNKLKNLLLKQVSTRASDASPRPNCTVPRPFALATERRASCGARAPCSEATSKLSVKLKENQPPISTKRNHMPSFFESRKPTQPENKKHPANDVTSRPTKPKIKVASAPVFRSTQRAEKRKEFNSKLEEKHQALEAEKHQCEERTKEETEAAIKELRKSMIFKASPMPNFYHSPQRLKHKKPASARAKCEKFGRRKSCSDADG